VSAPADLVVRRCALQAMYQFDAVPGVAPEVVRRSLDESDGTGEHHDAGFALACLAWEHRAEADADIVALAPDWPSHRQPMIDRNLLRLGWFELAVGKVPPGLAIGDAVELAKEFGTERSGGFVNGVLDQVAKRVAGGGIA
jgi:N utilization substance protein B